jgi:hypothetical protein
MTLCAISDQKCDAANNALFDHLVGALQDRGRHGEAVPDVFGLDFCNQLLDR